MDNTKRILLTGATGYIGGTVLSSILEHADRAKFNIQLLVRSREKADTINRAFANVEAVVGSYSDLQLLERLAKNADVVIACADADDILAAKAILGGMRQRFEATGVAPRLIHTSGTGVLVDDAQGQHATDTIYSDLDIQKIESLPLQQPHREVDVCLVEADRQGYIKTYIVLPSTIYGVSASPLVSLGVQNAHSQQIPRLVTLSIDRQQGGMVGKGLNIWPNVHIDDVADLYLRLFDANDASHGRHGFYFASNGEHSLLSVASTISQVLFDAGMSQTREPKSFTEEEMIRYFGGPSGTSLGTNSRCISERARMELGWYPKFTTTDMLESIDGEVRWAKQ